MSFYNRQIKKNVGSCFRMGLGRRKEHNTIVTRLGQEDGEHDGAGAFQKLVLSETSPRSLTSSVTAGTWLSPSVPRSLRCNCGLLNTSRWGGLAHGGPLPALPIALHLCLLPLLKVQRREDRDAD